MAEDDLSWYRAVLPFDILFFDGRPKTLAVRASDGHFAYFCLGGNTPVYKLLYRIPPFSSVRYPVKFLFLFFFIISVTSGLGLDKFRQGVAERNRRIHGAIHVFFYLGFLFALAWAYTVLFRERVVRLFDSIGFKPEAYNLIEREYP